MLEAKKIQRDANNFTLYRIFLLRVISVMTIFPHSIAPLKVVQHIFRKASECAIYCPWFLNVLSCSNFRKNLVLAFNIYSSFSTSKNIVQNAQECPF